MTMVDSNWTPFDHINNPSDYEEADHINSLNKADEVFGEGYIKLMDKYFKDIE